MTLGPLEYMLVEFEGNHFTGEILPELQSLRDRGIVRVVDLVFMQKDQNGTFTTRELSDLMGEEAKQLGAVAGDMLDLLSQEDLQDMADNMPNNTSAAIVLFEHLWAIRLRETIANAHGRVLSGGLISPDAVETLVPDVVVEHMTTYQG